MKNACSRVFKMNEKKIKKTKITMNKRASKCFISEIFLVMNKGFLLSSAVSWLFEFHTRHLYGTSTYFSKVESFSKESSGWACCIWQVPVAASPAWKSETDIPSE